MNDFGKGYIYNIGIGQGVTIPISNIVDHGPKFDSTNYTESFSATAGSMFTTTIGAVTEDFAKVSYYGINVPRGATVDENTGKIIWKPDASQIGNNNFQIAARDEFGRESFTSFVVTVYGSTTEGKSEVPMNPANPEPETSDGGEAIVPMEPVEPQIPGETESLEDTARFIDLGEHAWAEDAINALADEGIVKGTSENTFSPASNITRADFALLLVRAFGLSSDNTENFSDVSDSDYFAKELAIARNTGLVQGVGDNKYAPKNTITRQDMMLIVYRTLTKLGVEFESADVDYEDFSEVSDYAKDAVKALITNGFVNGKSDKIAPKDYTTRAEVAVLLKRILDYIK